ncbi:MAG: hypothetical protein H6961_10195 [Chromatiaceae bacterium]|nr:hypothetical protein [Chromatiaceae bacterium]
MKSDYEVIRADNIREYGEGTRHLEFLGQLYSDRTHFVYELLQNAEDKGAKQVKFDLFLDRLEFLHDGSPFTEADIRGICGVGQGTKTEDLTKIGKFGVGFKSVYAYTSSPRIHCGDEHFRIEHYVRPYQTDDVVVPDSWTTRFIFPFDNDQAGDAYREISDRLRHLNVRTLLFLSTIQEILWHTEGGESGYYLREVKNTHEARRVTVTGIKPGVAQEVEEENWLVFTRPVVTPDGKATRPVEIAYLLGRPTSKREEPESVRPLDTSPLFVFFATEKETRLGFLVQGPYKTTPARDNIPKDDRWNSYLIGETGHLVADSLVLLRKMGLLSVQALEAMPISKAHFPPDSMFRSIYEAVAKALTEQRLLPAEDGDYVAATGGVIGRGAEIRRLLSSDQLSYLLEDKDEEYEPQEDGSNPPHDENSEWPAGWSWLIGDISHERTPELRSYLTNELGVEEITPEWFARRVDKAFFEEQEDDWLVAFYRFLLKQEALWRPSKGQWSWGGEGPLRNAEIIRLEDGRQVRAFDDYGVEVVYLPGAVGVDLPYVKETLTKDEDAAEFLVRLGLRQPDIISQVIEHVLPKYEGEKINVSEEDHLKHINLISEALTVGSVDRVRKLKLRLDDAYWVHVRNAESNSTAWGQPGASYFRSPELELFLKGNPEVWFVDDIYDEDLKEMLRGLGVLDSPDISLRSADRRGFVVVERMHGYHRRGLDGFDPRCSVEHLEYAVKNPTIERSAFIWNQIARPLKNQIRGRVESSSRQTYEDSRIIETESNLGQLLLFNAWIPNRAGEFFIPEEIAPSDLPEEFEADEILSSQLGMPGSDLNELAKKSGLDLDDLNLIRELKAMMPDELQHMRDLVQRKKAKPDFPQRSSVDPERRVGQATVHANDAPEKQYEERTRNVRVTSPSVGKTAYLRQNYTNDEGELVCQLCHEEMPFRGRDGEYYFEAVQLFDDMSGEHAANHVALCPLCSAKYRELVKRDHEKSALLKEYLENTTELAVSVMLGAEQGTLRFVEKHLLDVKGALASEA